MAQASQEASNVSSLESASGLNTRTLTPASVARQSVSVYEAWKAFDFDASMTEYQKVYEQVIDNMTHGIKEKADLVAFVKDFSVSVSGHDTCTREEIQRVLKVCKATFVRLLERSGFSEQAFTGFFGKIGRLPDPTSHLLSTNVASATVAKLEAEARAREETEGALLKELHGLKSEVGTVTELRQEVSTHQQQLRDLEGQNESLRRDVQLLEQHIKRGEEKCVALEERNLALSEQIARIQVESDKKADFLQEEATNLSQQLADAQAQLEAEHTAAGGSASRMHDRNRHQASEALNAQLLAAEQRVGEHEAAEESLRRDLAKLSSELSAVKAEAAKLRSATDVFGHVPSDEDRKRLVVQKTLREIGVSFTPETDEVEAVLLVHAQCKALQSVVSKKEKLLTALQKQVAEASTTAEQQERRINDLRTDLRVAKDRLHFLTTSASPANGHTNGGKSPRDMQISGVGTLVPALGGQELSPFSLTSLNIGEENADELCTKQDQNDAFVSVDIASPVDVKVQSVDEVGLVHLLKTQREVLKDKLREVEAAKEELEDMVDTYKLKATRLEAANEELTRLVEREGLSTGVAQDFPPTSIPIRNLVRSVSKPGTTSSRSGARSASRSASHQHSSLLAAADTLTYRVFRILNASVVTRVFFFLYVLFLHFLVSAVLYYEATFHATGRRHANTF
ncbi:hypothetical protein DIPPA_02891 [Diplonema papillatum]|nr:hypothetical protein DIPPA_02891 [Diplonema papillatum]